MKRPPLDFLAVSDEVVRRSPGLAPCVPVVQKELLHIEILGGMHEAGLLRHLVFKGGTCLRLCYGSQRFSEDLDFSGGTAFTPNVLRDVEDLLRRRIGRAYGLDVDVRHYEKKPGQTVNRWVARVVTYRPEHSRSTARLGVQRIKIEIDDQPHPERTRSVEVTHPYREVVGAYTALTLNTTPMDDILADKLVAFPQSVMRRRNPRYRDVWDMHWLAPRVRDRRALFRRAADTASRQGWSEHAFADARAHALSRLSEIVDSDGFTTTMRRFLESSRHRTTVGDPNYRAHIVDTVRDLLEQRVVEIDPRAMDSVAP